MVMTTGTPPGARSRRGDPVRERRGGESGGRSADPGAMRAARRRRLVRAAEAAGRRQPRHASRGGHARRAAPNHAGQGRGAGRALLSSLRRGGPRVRPGPGLDLHPRRASATRARRSWQICERARRARRLSVRRAASCRSPARRSKATAAPGRRVHAFAARSRSPRCWSTAGSEAPDIKAGCGKCGACSALSTYERSARVMIFESVRPLPARASSASSSPPRAGSAKAPMRCGARSSATSRDLFERRPRRDR